MRSKRIHCHVRKGDIVKVLCGDSKGGVGEILQIIRKDECVIVKGVNVKKRIVKSRKKMCASFFEVPIHVSNVMLYDSHKNIASKTSTYVFTNDVKNIL